MFIKFFNVGQGDSTFIKFPNNTTMLIDCCIGENDSLNWLTNNLPEVDGRSILDYLVITHPHNDHIKGIKKLFDSVKINNIWESGHRLYIPSDEKTDYQDYEDMRTLIYKIAKEENCHIKLLADNYYKVEDEENVEIRVLSPSKAYLDSEKPSERDIHEQCLVLEVSCFGRKVTFTGDSSYTAWENHIVNNFDEKTLKTDILHVSHHGSHTFFKDKREDENEYVDALSFLSPRIAIISVGENNHGHPDENSLRIYEDQVKKGHVFRTDKYGAIEVEIDEKSNIRLMTENMKKSIGKITIGKFLITSTPEPQQNGFYKKNTSINFKIKKIKLDKNQEIKRYKWIVQNNSVNDDTNNDCYYTFSEENNYGNQTAYEGEHILLCEVYNNRNFMVGQAYYLVKVEA